MNIKLKNIIDKTETLINHDYLNTLVLSISSAIDMEYVFVARVDLEKYMSYTIALAKNGILSDNFEYSLKDTPCENVVDNSICSYNDVAEKFLNDKLLQDMEIKGYVGSPLYDSQKNLIGIFVALSKKNIQNTDFILSIMKIFSGRISAELDRMDKEMELQKVNSELKSLNESLEEKIRQATIDLSQAQSLSKIGSWRYDIQEDKLNWSDETYKIHGIDKAIYPVNTLNDFFKIVDPMYIEEVQAAYNEHLNNGKAYDVTHKLTLKDGSFKWIKEKCETSFDQNGLPLISNGILQDITAEVLRDRQLLQQSRLAQMGEMISMIAHQWRQPLGTISSIAIDLKMQSEFEKFDLAQKEQAKKYETYVNKGLDRIDEFVQILTNTIDDFRNFFRPNRPSELILFDEPINKALSIIKPSFISHGVDVQQINNCTFCDKRARMYSGEIMQVVLNILKNAQDNFKEKGIKSPKIDILCNCDNDKIILEICDNGGGIDSDIVEKIFDPYFSTKNEKNGTGLGLYMSKTIIEKHHNGKLLVENRNEGVCFKVELKAISQ